MDSTKRKVTKHDAGTRKGPDRMESDRPDPQEKQWPVIYPYEPSQGYADGDALEYLLNETREYLAPEDVEKIQRAYNLANKAHMGAKRKSGIPYIQHPLEVARILTIMRIDADGIVAALLHDVVEDTNYTLDQLREQFGPAVAIIVDGVTKFDAMDTRTDNEQAAAQPLTEEAARDLKRRIRTETVRKMLLAMAEDPRVVVIKLADRLHNMRTLGAMSPTQQQNTARETSEIFAPLARRLGMVRVQAELEDLCFLYLEPERYAQLAREVDAERVKRQPYIAAVCQTMADEMLQAGIQAYVLAWQKHLASIYRKLQQSGGDVSQLHDLFSFRILVDSDHECYLALGHIHALWRPKDGRIKDYIATPKLNGYQSLHTTVFCLENRLAEIQIRTHDMQRTADYGIASYWFLRERGGSRLSYREMISWIEQLREWQRELPQSADDFIEAVKGDIFQEQIFVFTPKGEVKDLPRGSTPLDMAYRIHTDIGDHCAGARIITNMADTERLVTRLVPLDYELKSGEIVDIVTNRATHPSRDWLTFARTANARTKIRRYLKLYEREINLQLGRERLDLALKAAGSEGIEAIHEEDFSALTTQKRFKNADDIYLALGREEIQPETVLEHLIPLLRLRGALYEPLTPTPASDQSANESDAPSASTPVPATVAPAPRPGIDEAQPLSALTIKLAHCCCPIPGDAIVGFLSPNKGLVVHRKDCRTVRRFGERMKDRLLTITWAQVKMQYFLAPIKIVAHDRAGLLRDVAAVVSDAGINMTAVASTTNASLQKATITATMEIQAVDQIERIFKRLLQVKNVVSVTRNLGQRAL